jgi:heme-binding NEAT domain protein
MKMFRWFSKLIVSTVLISSLSIVTTYYVVNLYVEEIFRQYQIPQLGKKIQFSDFTARLTQDLNIVKPDTKKQAAIQDKPGSAQPVSPTPGATSNPAGGASDSNLKDDAVAVGGRAQQGNTQNESSAGKKEVVLSTEQFAKKKDLITNEDKMKIFSLVASKLPQEEIQRLSTLLEEGLTSMDLQDVDQTLHKYLKEEEYQQLLDIINKY